MESLPLLPFQILIGEVQFADLGNLLLVSKSIKVLLSGRPLNQVLFEATKYRRQLKFIKKYEPDTLRTIKKIYTDGEIGYGWTVENLFSAFLDQRCAEVPHQEEY